MAAIFEISREKFPLRASKTVNNQVSRVLGLDSFIGEEEDWEIRQMDQAGEEINSQRSKEKNHCPSTAVVRLGFLRRKIRLTNLRFSHPCAPLLLWRDYSMAKRDLDKDDFSKKCLVDENQKMLTPMIIKRLLQIF